MFLLTVLLHISLCEQLCPHDKHDAAADVSAVTFTIDPADLVDEDATSAMDDATADVSVSKSSTPSPHLVHDVYAYIMHISPVLLTALCVAAEYYQLHCYTRYLCHAFFIASYFG